MRKDKVKAAQQKKNQWVLDDILKLRIGNFVNLKIHTNSQASPNAKDV